MKITSLSPITTFFLIALNSNAALVSFTGIITGIDRSNTPTVAGIVLDKRVGDQVTYVFDIDFGIEATFNPWGTPDGIESIPDQTITSSIADTTIVTFLDHFHAELIAGKVIPDVTESDLSAISMGTSEYVTKTFPGGEISGSNGQLFCGKFSNYTILESINSAVHFWDETTELYGAERLSISSGETIETIVVWTRFNIPSIPPPPPQANIPEATVGWYLLIAGVFLTAAFLITGRRSPALGKMHC